ncbi:DUF1902 domain-containing protein [Microvirga sp. M2]|uniref:DUF1902 domain-containing protein n=1 Tax=Microvirga sp. M2 TaxID=3073270 RepID=UPI0039C48014
MPSRLIVVKIAYDDEAAVWYIDQSTLVGLRAEAPTADALIDRIPTMITDLLDVGGGGVFEVPVEIIASTRTSVTIHEAA